MIKVGQFIIAGNWDDSPTPEGTFRIVMPPLGHVFGAGWHKHTQAALLALPAHLHAGMSFLELGAGSCILSIAAERLGASPVYATEINPEALEAGGRVIAANNSNVELINSTFIDEQVDVALVSISTKFAEDNRGRINAKKILVVHDDTSIEVVQ
jgi:ribosomal protein L11 methylase PrmA